MKNVSFTSKVGIAYSSIKKNMPKMTSEINGAAMELARNGRCDEVLITAKGPSKIGLKIITADGRIIKRDVVDERAQNALNAKICSEEVAYLLATPITPKHIKEIDQVYKADLSHVHLKKNPFEKAQNALIAKNRSTEADYLLATRANPNHMNEIEQIYKEDMAIIQKNPFDFGGAIINLYNKLTK